MTGHSYRMAVGAGCETCGNLVTCTCRIRAEHKPTCRYRRAAELSVELACEHDLQACPTCDPCDCGSTAALVPVA